MDTCLVNRNSPLRSGISPTLRHRSRPSESDGGNGNVLTPVSDILLNFECSNGKEKATFKEDNVNNQTQEESMSEGASVKTESKSMLGYFMYELTRGYKLEANESEFVQRRDRIYTSVNTPKNLEKFCAFGFLQCMDSILFMVTLLPLRILGALIRIVTFPFSVIFAGNKRHVLDAGQICDVLKGIILLISCYLTSFMDMSMIYHIVRGQSIIKFYVFYNMLDVLDKLISGFGQDVLDSLYWTAVESRTRKREHFGTIFHFIFAIAYVVMHTIMILVQAIILNVAFNSHNKTLLTIMISNNFIEIKVNLFKRLDKNNLCQITYADVKERFHYLVLLLFVFIRNMTELQWSWEMAFPILQDATIVLLAEVIVDWFKHAFITKFNELSASTYGEFALGLAQDIASSQKKHAFTNFSDQVCRRMGFTPMPLICLLFMVCSKSFNFKGTFSWVLVGLLYLCLVSTKVLNSIVLLGWAQRLINEKHKNAKGTGTVVNSQVIPKKEEKGSVPPAPAFSPSNPVVYQVQPVVSSKSNIAVNTDESLCINTSSSSSSFLGLDTSKSSEGQSLNMPPSQGSLFYSKLETSPDGGIDSLTTCGKEGFSPVPVSSKSLSRPSTPLKLKVVKSDSMTDELKQSTSSTDVIETEPVVLSEKSEKCLHKNHEQVSGVPSDFFAPKELSHDVKVEEKFPSSQKSLDTLFESNQDLRLDSTDISSSRLSAVVYDDKTIVHSEATIMDCDSSSVQQDNSFEVKETPPNLDGRRTSPGKTFQKSIHQLDERPVLIGSVGESFSWVDNSAANVPTDEKNPVSSFDLLDAKVDTKSSDEMSLIKSQ